MMKLNLFQRLLKTLHTDGSGFAGGALLSVLLAYIRSQSRGIRSWLCAYFFFPMLLGGVAIQAQEHTFGWAVSMNLNTTRLDAALFSTAVDADGNVYTAGQFEGTNVDFDPGPGTYLMSSKGSQDIFVQKLDANGNFLWAKSYGSTGAAVADVAYGVAVDGLGNVYVTGRFAGTIQFNPGSPDPAELSVTSADIFVLKLGTDGNFLWVRRLGGASFNVGNDITIDAAGNVYTTGTFQGTADFDPGPGVFNLVSAGGSDIFVQKMDTNGNFVWAKSMGGTGTDTGYSLAVDASQNVYITGSFIETADFDPGSGVFTLNAGTARNIFVSKLNADGSFGWARSLGTLTVHNDGYDIAADASGNVYVTGAFRGTNVAFGTHSLTSITSGSNDAVIFKMDTNGNVVWAKNIGGAGADGGYSIAVDGSENVYTTGLFAAGVDIDFDPGAGTYPLPAVGSADIFVHMLDKDGNFVWAKAMGAAGSDSGHSITVDGLGNVYTSGRFTQTVDFDPGSGTFPLTVSGGGTYAAFIQKLKPVINLTAIWDNGAGAVAIADGDELELTYGEQGTLTFTHNNADSPSPTFVFVQDPVTNVLLSISGTGNTYTATGIRVNGSGEEGKIKATLPATTNFDAAEMEFKVKVKHRPITVSTNETSKEFGEPDPAFTYAVTQGSLVSGHTSTGTLSRVSGEAIAYYNFEPGSLAIMQGTNNVTSNYEITIDPAQFQILGMQLTVTATGGLSKTYGSADPTFTYAITQGTIPAGYSLTGALSRAPGDNAGNYAFEGSALVVRDGSNNDVSANYTIMIDPNINFTIVPVQLAVAAVALNKRYGENDPALTYTVAGLVNNEQAADIFTGALQRAPGEDAGVYPVSRHTLALNSTNYTWNPNSFIPADFTILKAVQQINLTAYPEVQLNAGSLPLTVSSSSGLPVTLVTNNTAVATISNTDLVLFSAGTVTVTATQEGSNNYEAAPQVTVTVRVIDPESSPLIHVNQAVSPNGDGVNDFLQIENIEKYPDNRMTIFDRSGNIVKEIVGYDNSQRVFTGEHIPEGTYFYRLGLLISGDWQYYQGFIVVKKN